MNNTIKKYYCLSKHNKIMEMTMPDTMYEINTNSELSANIFNLVKQLKLANKLKCLELKARFPEIIAQVDDIEDRI